MRFACTHGPAQRVTALIAVLFGVVTLFAGVRVLLGVADAGHYVVQPVLLFNTVMGAVYLATAVLIVRDVQRGRRWALFVALANLVVLAAILVLRATGGVVANETLAAMTLRAVVWIAIATALGFSVRRSEYQPS